jgi:rhamnogalacturonan endolyase
MKPFRLAACALAILSYAGAAQAAVTVEKSKVDAPVTITENANGSAWVLDNGIVKVTVNKQSGQIRSIVYKEIETMSAGGSWEQSPTRASVVNGLTQLITVDPKTNGGTRGEVSVKGVTKGDPNAGLSPNSPGQGAQGTINLDLELRTTLGRGESGVYTYAIFSHPAEYGALSMPESRFITFISKTFDWMSVDNDRNMLAPAPRDWGTGVVVHAKEQRIMSQGYYKNSVEHKYSYNAVQYKIPAWGYSSTKQKIGIYFINPSIEYLSGGASKQELVAHYHDNANPDPVILNYWRGTHYGGGATADVPAGEAWSKVIGPIFVYVNSLDSSETPTQADLDTLEKTAGNPTVPAAWRNNATALWHDALDQAKKEKAAWPYDWVKGVDYPHKNERGGVKGQIVLNDTQAASAKLPNLTVGLTHADYPRAVGAGRGGAGRGATTAPAGTAAGAPTTSPAFARGGPTTGPAGRGGFAFNAPRLVDWAHDAKYYQFWNDGDENGNFTITNARPGNYVLRAFANGVLGEFAQANVTVEAGKTVDLGKLEWKPVRNGKQIWEIGYPSRAGDKFLKGDGDNYWLWGWGLRYALLFPKDIVYTIGKSDYRKDWFFQQTPRATSMAWVNPEAKDPANQRFGWVKAESTEQYPQTDTTGPWRVYGRGEATTWTIKFNMDQAPRGQAYLRIALAGADGQGGLAVGVNGKEAGTIRPTGTNSLRYNTNKSVWYEYTQPFDATLMKQGENELTLTVPAGELTSGVTYDYLRLELNENAPAPTASIVP